MQNNGSILYDHQINKSTGRRHIRRQRTYTLQQAITPKTCGLLPGSQGSENCNFSEVKTSRIIYVIGGLIFVGIGLFNILF